MVSVDVVVLRHNHASYLPRCVESILSQQGVDVRILIIDVCSAADNSEASAELHTTDSRIEYRRHAASLRHIAVYNEGLLGWARADYSLLLSADAFLAPDALQRATSVMERHHGVHMTYGMSLLFWDDSAITNLEKSIATPSSSVPDHRLITGPDFVRACIHGNPVPTPSAIVRTRMQQALGGYSATLPHTADLEMWMRFAVYGSIGVVPYVLSYKRTHANNMSTQYSDRPLGDYRERLDACLELLATHGAALGKSAPSLPEVKKTIATEVFWTASRFADAGQKSACDEALAFAAQLWPTLTESSEWKRLKVKRIVPKGFRSRVLPLFDSMRGLSLPSAEASESNMVPYRQIGWWPETA